MTAKTEHDAALTSAITGLKAAVELLVRQLHHAGKLDGHEYVAALKRTYNQPDAVPGRMDYETLRLIANSLDKDLPRKDG